MSKAARGFHLKAAEAVLELSDFSEAPPLPDVVEARREALQVESLPPVAPEPHEEPEEDVDDAA